MLKLSNSFHVSGLRKIEDVNLGRHKLFAALAAESDRDDDKF